MLGTTRYSIVFLGFKPLFLRCGFGFRLVQSFLVGRPRFELNPVRGCRRLSLHVLRPCNGSGDACLRRYAHSARLVRNRSKRLLSFGSSPPSRSACFFRHHFLESHSSPFQVYALNLPSRTRPSVALRACLAVVPPFLTSQGSKRQIVADYSFDGVKVQCD